MTKGKFIVFEGINGAGKDTLITSVAAAIRNQDSFGTVTMTGQPWPYEGWEYIFYEDADGSDHKTRILDNLDNTGKAMLYCANRMHHIQKCINPSLEQFDWVLCSRWTPSTVIYQSETPELRGEWGYMAELLAVYSRLSIEPDYFFWIDTPPDIAAERMAKRGDIPSPDKLEALHVAYEDFFQGLRLKSQEVSILDGTKSIPNLTSEVIEVLKSLSTK
jgi:dTMP kinase